MGQAYVIGTCDTKGDELAFAVSCLRDTHVSVCLVDVSTAAPAKAADISAEIVASFHPNGRDAVLGLSDRGQAVTAMGVALKNFVLSRSDVDAVLGLGGSGNTAIVTEAMRALPIGLPKVMVSTLASGNVAGFVGPTDIVMMHSVTDIAGLNAISRAVISNAAHAVAGMVLNPKPKATERKQAYGFTMFGVTTTCINEIRKSLRQDVEAFVFHATGTGGQSFEKLAESGYFDGAFDITTTEVADYLVGGILPCTPDRFGAFARRAVPYVGSVGACDMVNFGARETVPAAFSSRRFHIHNPHVTLMRTTPDENARIGQFIAAGLNKMTGPVRFLLPLRGVSAIDAAGQPFFDAVADQALFDAIRKDFKSSSQHKSIELDLHINDPAFALAAVSAMQEMLAS